MVEDVRNFEPSELQLGLLSAFQDANYLCTVEDACGQAEMTSRTYRRWFDDPAFAAWWHLEAEQHFGRLLPKAWALVWSAANGEMGGSAADRKLLIERFDAGFAPKRRNETELTGKLSMTWGEMVRAVRGDEESKDA